MEDHHNNHTPHHHQHHHHPQQYTTMSTDLRQLVNGTRSTHFTPIPTAADEFFTGHRNLTALLTTSHPNEQQQQYEMMMLGRGVNVLEDFNNITTHHVQPPPPTATTTTTAASVSTPETTGCIGGDASTGRWPRQETLTLLEIRSRLDPKFKEANQKGPLWDEVSRYKYNKLSFSSSSSSYSTQLYCSYIDSFFFFLTFYIFLKILIISK